jgi:periplasmic protein TonB
MTVLAREDRSDLLRWVFSGALVLCAHGGLAAAMVQWNEPFEPEDTAAAIVIELAPLPVASMQVPNDIAPGPEQVEAEMLPDQPVEKIEEKVEEKIEQAPNPEVALLLPQEAKPEPPKPMETQPAPATTAPQVPSTVEAALPAAPTEAAPNTSTSNAVPRWKSQVVGMLERNKRYPSDARNRHEQGVTQLAFSIDRQGRVVASRIVTSSGSSALDKEALDLAQRAQPFPPPPPELAGAQISLTVPIRFNIK